MRGTKTTEGPLATYRYVCGSLAAITAVTSTLPVTATANTSSADFDMRRQAANLTGTPSVTDYTEQVTRGDFTRMLTNAFGYRENLPSSSVSVFVNVSDTHLDTVYIRIAASQGWMAGFLGGFSKPKECITYKDAIKAALAMLGYSDEDFTRNLASSRVPKFNCLELNEEMNRQPEEVLNQTDRISLFYNLLEIKKKDSSEIYGAVLNCELSSDREINSTTILDDERKGSILMRRGFNVIQSMPFESENANVLLNGTTSTLEAAKASQQDVGSVVVYYNVKSKIIWAYITRGWNDDDPEGNSAYVLLKSEIRNIYYKSTDVMAPTPVRLETDDDNSNGNFGRDGISEGVYLTINLSSSELQYPFSIYDGMEVGDEVVTVCNKSGSSYTAVDAIER